MNIAGLEYNLPHKALEIYLSGCCPPFCENCHNPELWDFNIGKNWKDWLDKILKKVDDEMVERVWILGGEPLDQDRQELMELLSHIKKEIWLWTKQEFSYHIVNEFHDIVDYIKFGKYDLNLPGYLDTNHNIKLSSNNQVIIDVKKGIDIV